MTERELVRLAKDGDERAFEQLVTDNEKRIYNLCRRLAGNPEDAAELTQEAFLNAWRGLSGFQEGSTFSTWLYRLATNACMDFLRREKRRRSLSLTVSLDDEEEAVQVELPDERYAPEEHRQVLILRELNGLSYQEIARVLDLEEGTVKSRIARARGALRKILLEEGNFFRETASRT